MKASLPKLTLVLGGSRSGKSRFAQNLPPARSAVAYWATGMAVDVEMRKRIDAHRKSRPAHWDVMEEPRDLLSGLKELGARNGHIVLLDSLTTWAGNLFHKPLNGRHGTPMEHLRAFLDGLTKSKSCWIIVSDEVGMGIVPDSPMGRSFKDFLGDANQLVAAEADAVYLVSAGIPLKIK